jgi:hypothetical protein
VGSAVSHVLYQPSNAGVKKRAEKDFGTHRIHEKLVSPLVIVSPDFSVCENVGVSEQIG